jgi:hypothetical protein
MNRRYIRVCLAAFLAWPALLASTQHRASASAVSAPAGPQLTLVAEKHPGVATITADLGESVPFKATWTGTLQKGEYLAILTGKALVSQPRAQSHVAGADTYDTEQIHHYVAEVYTRIRVIKKSNVITVDWQDLSLALVPVSHVQGTLTADANADPPAYHQLQGIPIQLSARASPEFATSWKTIQILDTADDKVLYAFHPGNKQFINNISTADPLGHEYIVKALDAAGHEVKLSKPVAVFTRNWNVDVETSGPNGSSSGDLNVNLGDQVQVTAVIKEPNAQELAQYVTTDVTSNPNDETKYKTEKECPHAWTCSVSVSRSAEEAVPFIGGAVVPDNSGKTQEAGISQERMVTWAGPPPKADDYNIEYWISGGSGDCTMPPPAGYSFCYPGPRGNVKLTAQVFFQGHPMTETDQLPFGYFISWSYSDDPVDIPNCPARAPICTVSVNGPASGATTFEATMENKFSVLVYWTLKLTAAWENRPPGGLIRRL